MELVVLVDENDIEIGAMEKMEAHRTGRLHRAFSILIFNSRGELLIQQRAKNKYHSGTLWTNTCCSHPRPGESIQGAAERRLKEEMGINTTLKLSHKFIYQAKLDNGLIEYELDYVFTGVFNGEPEINNTEVLDWKFISISKLHRDISNRPDNFTHWFKIIISNWNKKAA